MSSPSRPRKINWGQVFTHVALAVLVVLWTIPTLGLFVSSLRDKDQLIISGWWTAFSATERNAFGRTGAAAAQVEVMGRYVIEGAFLDDPRRTILSYGLTQFDLQQANAGESVAIEGSEFTLFEDGRYQWVADTPFEHSAGRRIFYTARIPPTFSLQNYRDVIASERIDRAFINTFTVTIPATVIPILIAAFAAYAFAWMKFPGRQVLFAIVVGLLVVPLQMSLIPLLRMYNEIGALFGVASKSYLGIWLAHTGFGLPLAVYLLRNYIGGLPRDIIESAQLDGASHFDIFVRLILPLSVPALASFAIFQFLWVWNDLLVALVFLGKGDDQIVLTSALRELLGSRGDNWEILTSSAFISILVPLGVFFSLQRYFVRGLLAGSVKGG
jgi:alpha-glucoside transport system permease protein